jgi:hypothetical protein
MGAIALTVAILGEATFTNDDDADGDDPTPSMISSAMIQVTVAGFIYIVDTGTQ